MAAPGALLLFSRTTPVETPGVVLPSINENLFQRIIRNPRPESPKARERECAEMLCAILINAPSIRRRILSWMANLAEMPVSCLEGLAFEFATEQGIGAKRDDLRIEGWLRAEDYRQLVLLWSVEVKVGAAFHQSSDTNGSLVNQLENYDCWLDVQQATHRAGFVLTIRDMTPLLPPALRCRWVCMTWTQLAGCLEESLKEEGLSAADLLLGGHVFGFIRDNLWSSEEMTQTRVGFDDIAMMRAVATHGSDFELKFTRLVELLPPLIEASRLGHGKITEQVQLYRMHRVAAYRYLVAGLEDDPHPSLTLALGYEEPRGDFMGALIEINPTHPAIEAVYRAATNALTRLKKRNPYWEVPPIDPDNWSILELRVPLTTLLEAADQEEAVCNFMNGAIADLKSAGVIPAIVKAVKSKVSRRKR